MDKFENSTLHRTPPKRQGSEGIGIFLGIAAGLALLIGAMVLMVPLQNNNVAQLDTPPATPTISSSPQSNTQSPPSETTGSGSAGTESSGSAR